jgi:LCP family protein required for cell wall assembly
MSGTSNDEPGIPEYGDRRGSHATTYGQGFSWVLIWTIVGALIPGSGLVAAGWRRLGAFMLLVLGLGLAGLAAAALTGDVLQRALNVALDTKKLLYVTAGAIILGLIWAAVILFTHSQLRRYANLTTGQRIFSGFVVAALLVGVAIPAYKVGSYAMIQRDLVNSITTGSSDDAGTTTEPNHKKADPWADIPRMNVLLIGSDAGKGRIGTRPDTMIVASIDTKSGNTVLFSLPRNLERAPFPPGTGGAKAFPNGFYCKADACLLNAVWAWAEGAGRQYYSKYRNPGLKATEDAIQGVTGLKINQYASLNLRGFQDFVSAIGGITVNVNERLPIGGSSEHPVATGWIEKGQHQQLDGYHALWFARSRWSTNDFDRMRRQRCVIGAVVKKANPTVMVKKFPAIAKAAKNNMSTGIKTDDLDAWVTLALRVKKAKVTSLPFDDKVVTDRVNPDYELIHRLVRKALEDSMKPEPKETATATPTPGSSPSSTTGTKKKTPAKTTDPEVAQSINDVC